MEELKMLKAKLMIVAVAIVFALASPVSWAGEHEVDESEFEKYELNDVSCKDVMLLSGVDREAVISFVHGYLAGEAKKTVVDLIELGRATDTFMDRCLDSPTSKAFSTMRTILSEKD
jgi:hypothetical protein